MTSTSLNLHQPHELRQPAQIFANICATCDSAYGPSSRPESFSDYDFIVAGSSYRFRSDVISAKWASGFGVFDDLSGDDVGIRHDWV